MNRFGDIEPSSKRLPPVYGFRSEKLVSLETALESIVSQIDELPYYIKIAKKSCHFPNEHNLSKDQSAAIYIYTMEWGETTLYRVLNKALRSENRQALKIWFPYLKLFDTALDLLPTVKGALWRGISLNIGKDFVNNQIVTWWSVNSCSSSVAVIKSFLGNETNSTLFLIEAIHGKRVSGYTEFENEDEVILRMGTRFRVKSDPLAQANGAHIVHLVEEDENDDETPISPMEKMSVTPISSMEKVSVTPKASNETPSNTKCNQHGTIAGGNGQGNQLNQLSRPYGICVDNDHQCIYIADYGNHRIVEWKYGAKNGKVIADGNGQGNGSNQLNTPTDVIVDKKNNSIIIADNGNKRVMQQSRQNDKNKQIIISNIDSHGLAMDNNGDLYVSDVKKNEVRRWKIGDKNGTLVAGGNGGGNDLNQLSYPTYIFVDKDYSVYVSDLGNYRVMKWVKGAKEGIVVAGGYGLGNSVTQLSECLGVIVDHLGNVYVADPNNCRIMCWCEGSKEGSIVVGGDGEGEPSNQSCRPTGLSFDGEGNLYFADGDNHRVQKLDKNAN